MKTPRRTIWLVRHGERVDNIDDKWKETAKRWDDPPLSTRGHVQSREVGVRLRDEKIDHVICSPFTRCVQTVSGILSEHKEHVPIFIEPGLGESMNVCNNPPGRPTLEQICEMNPSVDPSYQPIFSQLPPEEGGDDCCTLRIAITVRKILDKYPTGNLLFVSHGSPIAACHLEMIGTWNYVGQCTLGKIVDESGQLTCEFYGNKEHLSDKTRLRDVQSKSKLTQNTTILNS